MLSSTLSAMMVCCQKQGGGAGDTHKVELSVRAHDCEGKQKQSPQLYERLQNVKNVTGRS